MVGTADRLLEHTPAIDHLVGLVQEVVGHDPQVQALPRLNLVVVVPNKL